MRSPRSIVIRVIPIAIRAESLPRTGSGAGIHSPGDRSALRTAHPAIL